MPSTHFRSASALTGLLLLRVDFFFFFAWGDLTGEKSGECGLAVLCSVIGFMKTARVGQKEANPLATNSVLAPFLPSSWFGGNTVAVFQSHTAL